jgi:uncharacterized phage protein (TIGR01671 family)
MKLKFRAWLNVHKEFITQGDYYDFSMICNGDGFGIVSHQDENRWLNKDEFEIMQFTGLTDRHGKEIYVGDIVNEDLAMDGKWQSVGVVEFYEGSFGSRNGHDRFRIPALFTGKATEGMNLNYYEIIGNIYQNPELIPEILTR